MLSAAFRGAAPTLGSQPISVQPRLPPVFQQQQSRGMASSMASSLAEEPLFESPRASVGIPLPSRPSAHAEADGGSVCSDGEQDLFEADEFETEGPSAGSSATHHGAHSSYLHTPGVMGHLATGPSTPAPLASGGNSGDFTIGRAALGHGGSGGSLNDLQAELEHLSSGAGGGRGSRPIGIPRPGPSTYTPAAGVYMQGFVPPHQMTAASVQHADPMVMHSQRHKSIADRLRTVVFEQTGHMSLTTAAVFLQTTQGFQPKGPQA